MKYFFDAEFLEGCTPQRILGISIPTWLSKPLPNIQLISIGIVSEGITDKYSDTGNRRNIEGDIVHITKEREYYAICKDFDLKAAWNNEWLMENVLRSIWKELWFKAGADRSFNPQSSVFNGSGFTYKNFKKLINKYGKTREHIAKEIYEFINPDLGFDVTAYNNSAFRNKDSYESKHFDLHNVILDEKSNCYVAKPELYTYYTDYDFVIFCQLFGRMIDLPNGFPRFAFDLKQELDRKGYELLDKEKRYIDPLTIESALDIMKHMPNYPKQTNEHNALASAKWNKELHKFIQSL